MAFNVNDFVSRGLEYGGARPALFEVRLTPPNSINVAAESVQKFTFMCQAAQLPAASVSQIEVPYFGRRIKVAGERSFDNWQVSVMNDEDFKVRSLFEYWSNALNSLESNLRQNNLTDESYKADLEVIQYSKDSEVLRSYSIVGAFPTDISSIDLSWETTGSVETFTVAFAYDYWLPVNETSSKGSVNQYSGAV